MIFHSSKSRLEKGWFIHWKFPYPLMQKSTRKVGFATLFNHLCTREKSTRTSLLRKLKNTEYPFHLCKSRPEKVRAVPWRYLECKKWVHRQTSERQTTERTNVRKTNVGKTSEKNVRKKNNKHFCFSWKYNFTKYTQNYFRALPTWQTTNISPAFLVICCCLWVCVCGWVC